jgi:hypothetical protein
MDDPPGSKYYPANRYLVLDLTNLKLTVDRSAQPFDSISPAYFSRLDNLSPYFAAGDTFVTYDTVKPRIAAALDAADVKNISALGFAGADKLLVQGWGADKMHRLALVDTTQNKVTSVIELPGQQTPVERGVWSPDRAFFVWVMSDAAAPHTENFGESPSHLNVLTISTGKLAGYLPPNGNFAFGLTFAGDSSMVFLSAFGGQTIIFDLKSRQVIDTPDTFKKSSIVFGSRAANLLVVRHPSGYGGKEDAWSAYRFGKLDNPLWSVPARNGSIVVTPDAKMLFAVKHFEGSVSAGIDLQYAAIKDDEQPTFKVFKARTDASTKLAMSPKGDRLLVLTPPYIQIIDIGAIEQTGRDAVVLDLRDGKRAPL